MGYTRTGERQREACPARELREVRDGGWEDGGFLRPVLLKGQQQSLVTEVGWGQLAAAL